MKRIIMPGGGKFSKLLGICILGLSENAVIALCICILGLSENVVIALYLYSRLILFVAKKSLCFSVYFVKARVKIIN